MRAGIEGLLFDMDGVLYHGEQVIPAALEFFDWIGDLPRAFVTNNPILTPADYADKLARLGFPRPDPNHIISAGIATAQYLQQQKPGFKYFAIGAEGLHQVLVQYGTNDSKHADFVVVGEGPGIDFDTLTTGLNLIQQQGAQLICTNPDNSVDAVHNGQRIARPGGGALVAPLEIASGQKATIIGKPEAILYQMALNVLGLKAHQCLMIGDRPDTDIAGATRLGIKTALVRTGRFAVGDAWPKGLGPADFDVRDLFELKQALQA